MLRKQLLTIIILVAICVIAVSTALSAVVLQGNIGAATVAAVALLAMAQLIAYLSRGNAKADALERLSDLMAACDTFSRDVAILRARIDRLEADRAGDAGKTLSRARPSIGSRQERTTDVPHVSASQTTDHGQHDTVAPTKRAEPVLLGVPASDLAQLYLEPIVRLTTNKTAYYRAMLGLEDAAVPINGPGPVMAQGLTLFKQVAPVIRQFQDRKRSIGVFCPLTAVALADDGFIDRLVRFVGANRDIAGALVIDISQDQLALLDERGQQGLAHLAELGATFALSQCRLNVPDLEVLKQLGFGFIDADVELLINAKRHAPCPAGDVLAEARRLEFSVIAADVTKHSELAWIEDSFALARGSLFAPPRPVRHDITSPESLSAAA